MTGYIKTHRSVFEHELFSGDEFSRREAWLWLVANAAWKPHRTRHKNAMIDIGRGQLPGSRKHLASVWKWGEQRVRTFLSQLEAENMISVSSNQQLTILTICNYTKFQHSETEANQEITSCQPAHNHTEEVKELKEKKKELSAQAKKNDPFGFVPASNVSRCELTGSLTIEGELLDFWLPLFGSSENLSMALKRASGYIQVNSTKPLEAQVSSQLAQQRQAKLDQDARYLAAAVEKSRTASTQPRFKSKVEERHAACLEAMEAMGAS